MIEAIDGVPIDFQRLVDHSLNTIWIVGEEKIILYFNKASLQLLHINNPEKLQHRNIGDFFHPDFHEICKQRLMRVLDQQEAVELMEQKMVCVDGEIIDVEVMATPFIFEDTIFAQVTIRDITKRKKAERELRNHDKLAALGQMSAGIAHEIRNPLTAVKGFVQLLREEMDHHYLTVVDNELNKALDTINNLLQVSKPDVEDELPVKINLCNELDATLFLFQEKVYNISVIKKFSDRDKQILGKKSLLLKAFFNLIKNAIEATPAYGQLTVEHYFANDYIHLKFIDTGVGIPEDKIALLGTPFFSTKNYGTGMGLTQVYTAVYEHKSAIQVQSILNEGTTFHIQLPISELS